MQQSAQDRRRARNSEPSRDKVRRRKKAPGRTFHEQAFVQPMWRTGSPAWTPRWCRHQGLMPTVRPPVPSLDDKKRMGLHVRGGSPKNGESCSEPRETPCGVTTTFADHSAGRVVVSSRMGTSARLFSFSTFGNPFTFVSPRNCVALLCLVLSPGFVCPHLAVLS